MSLLSLALLILIAGVCGAVGQAIAGHRSGFLLSVGVGFIGALLGVFLARLLSLPEWISLNIGGTTFPVVWSIIGSALFSVLLGYMRGRRRR